MTTTTTLTSAQQEWLGRVTLWQRSGLDRDSFAAREGIASKRLRWWHWNLGRLGLIGPTSSAVTSSAALSFVRLDAAVEAAAWLEVVANGRVVRVPVGFDETTLARVLDVVDGGAR